MDHQSYKDFFLLTAMTLQKVSRVLYIATQLKMPMHAKGAWMVFRYGPQALKAFYKHCIILCLTNIMFFIYYFKLKVMFHKSVIRNQKSGIRDQGSLK